MYKLFLAISVFILFSCIQATSACNGAWWKVGNWTPNIENFPNGLKPVTDAAHKVGAKFLLWFEPERVTRNTQFADKNPDWLLNRSGKKVIQKGEELSNGITLSLTEKQKSLLISYQQVKN